MLYTRIDVAENQRALLWRNDNFVRVLGPGRYRIPKLGRFLRVRTETYDLTNPIFENPLAEFLVKARPELQKLLRVVEIGEQVLLAELRTR